jgi:SOS-response transcriptional repressor LexA
VLTQIVNKFKATGVTVEWLLTGNPRYLPNHLNSVLQLEVMPNTEQTPEHYGFVPVISWALAKTLCDVTDMACLNENDGLILCPISHSKSTYALKVKGDSMTSPFPSPYNYPEGTIIYVDPCRELTECCRVIAKLPDSNEVTFKEYREDGGKRYLKPLNPQYQLHEITAETVICGIVIGQFRAE